VSLSRLYAVLDTGVAVGRGWTVADLGQAFLDGGAKLIQLRAKHLDARALLDAADRLVRLAEPAGARIIVNDRADVRRCAARPASTSAGGSRTARRRALLGDRAMIGLSTHSPGQVDAALTAHRLHRRRPDLSHHDEGHRLRGRRARPGAARGRPATADCRHRRHYAGDRA
jgi:thiamine-phosphate pyrophosphorylase